MRLAAALILSLVLGSAVAPAARADDTKKPTPGQREKWKDRLANMTPEQREKLKQLHEKLKNLTPEQREKLKERLKEKRGG